MSNLIKRHTESNKLNLKEKLNLSRSGKCLLVDTSGSMYETTEIGKAKYVIVNEILSKLELNRIKLFEFNDSCNEVTNIGLPTGSTNLSEAFNTIKNKGCSYCLLVTDGRPNNAETALEASKGLNIDIIYIGNPPVPEFLTKLGTVVDNSFNFIELNKIENVKELENKIKGFISE